MLSSQKDCAFWLLLFLETFILLIYKTVLLSEIKFSPSVPHAASVVKIIVYIQHVLPTVPPTVIHFLSYHFLPRTFKTYLVKGVRPLEVINVCWKFHTCHSGPEPANLSHVVEIARTTAYGGVSLIEINHLNHKLTKLNNNNTVFFL